MAYRKHHDIWSGPIIEYYGYSERHQTCGVCTHYESCRRTQRGKRVCSAFAFARKGAEQPSATEKAEKPPSTGVSGGEPLDWVARTLKENDIPFVDRRMSHGYLWVVGKRSTCAKRTMSMLAEQGAVFEFSQKGCGATGGRQGWFLRGFPKKAADLDGGDTSLAVTGAGEEDALELDGVPALRAGDCVEHGDCGLGIVRAIKTYGNSTSLAEVDFGGEVRYFSARALAGGEIRRVKKPKGKKKG